MRMRQSLIDSFQVDKVLFPNRARRYALYLFASCGILLAGVGAIVSVIPNTTLAITSKERLVLGLLVAGVFILLCSLLVWGASAVRYVVQKEYHRGEGG